MRLQGRPIAPGRATGRVLLSQSPISFLGGVDRSTGAVREPGSDARGHRLRGRVLAFPNGHGSTVGSYVLYGLAKRGLGPRAIVVGRAEAIVATGAILGGIPAIDRVDLGALADGDGATVDGTRGTVSVPGVTERPVVSAFLENRGRFLVLRRGRRVGSFRGRWSAVSGFLEGDEPAAARARREILEETGIRKARLVATAPVLWARDGDAAFAIHPFLFRVDTRRVRLDWENLEARWVPASAVRSLNAVPRLDEVLAALLHAAGESR